MAKELQEGPAADRAWYQTKKSQPKTNNDDKKPKMTKSKQKRQEAKSMTSSASTKDADFFAREAKRNRKPKKIRAVVDRDDGGAKRKGKNGVQKKKKSMMF
jgi:hypothetical protein